MFNAIADLLKKLIVLAQERNNLALESLSVLRDINKSQRLIEDEMDAQTKLLGELVTAVTPPAPLPATSLVLTLGSAVPQ